MRGNDEFRMTNDELLSKSAAEDDVAVLNEELQKAWASRMFSPYVLSHSFVIRHWSFVI